jgi:hypothetical protein
MPGMRDAQDFSLFSFWGAGLSIMLFESLQRDVVDRP